MGKGIGMSTMQKGAIYGKGLNTFVPHCRFTCMYTYHQGSQIRQNCSDDSTEVMEGVNWTPEIFGNKQGATSTPEILGNKHSFVLTFFATNTIYVNCKRCQP